MKRKVKKQIKHWRRSFKRKGLSQRAERVKDKDPIIERKGKTYFDAEESDECWDIYDPWEQYYWTYYDENLEHFNLHHRLLETIIQLPESQFIELQFIKNKIKPTIENYKENVSSNYLLLEESLHEHIEILQCIRTEEIADTASYLRDAAGGKENIEAVLEFSNRIGNMKVARAIMFFSPFWVRNPHSWEGSDHASFIKHVFTQFVVPDYLIHEWLRDHESLRLKWLSWLIILGQGGSLKRASTYFHWRIPSGLQHQLQSLTSDLSPLEACFYAELRRLGGNDTDAIRLIQNRIFVIDPTELKDENTEDNYFTFWLTTIQWLIKHRNNISDDESNIILNWAMHQYTETERNNCEALINRENLRRANDEQFSENLSQNNLQPLQTFTMKGRSPKRVIEHSRGYQRQQSLPWAHYSWKNHGWDLTYDNSFYPNWEIVELTNGKELYTEGQFLGHCVSGYAGRCVANASAIFSMRKNGQRVITIEINPVRKEIIQARGKFNRSADKKEHEVILEWVKEVLRK